MNHKSATLETVNMHKCTIQYRDKNNLMDEFS